MKKTILVPVDFSSHSEAALLKACEWSECMKATIKVLHVVHAPDSMPGYYSRITKKKTLLRMEDIAQEMLDDFIKETIKSHPDVKALKKVGKILVLGLPVSRILEIADKEKASIVIMGSRGNTGLQHILLGSKAEQVVRLCPVPVTIVKNRPKK